MLCKELRSLINFVSRIYDTLPLHQHRQKAAAKWLNKDLNYRIVLSKFQSNSQPNDDSWVIWFTIDTNLISIYFQPSRRNLLTFLWSAHATVCPWKSITLILHLLFKCHNGERKCGLQRCSSQLFGNVYSQGHGEIDLTCDVVNDWLTPNAENFAPLSN